jgi:aryl-alcohol dehydrogenase-like predicted oxidoreductase/enamine deaminase RidA (YjgF/YER057c/UK114 family)
MQARKPERVQLSPGLDIPRIVTGLWQLADMERHGAVDPDRAAEALADYVADGFDAFDMADHYGPAEDVVGRYMDRLRSKHIQQPPNGRRPVFFTKWVPYPGPMTPRVVREGVGRALERMKLDRIDLMQFHWWMFEHPAYLDALAELAAMRNEGKLSHVGLTNFDAGHLRLVYRNGIPVSTNQVSFSLLDRRAAGRLTKYCLRSGVRILAYGTLAGGFLTDRWLGKPEPTSADIPDWSKSKYKRFIDEIGGWPVLQSILSAAARVGRRHGVSVANVATRWVLEQPAVAAAIVGARLGESEHRKDNLRVFAFALDEEDHEYLNLALAKAKPVPGDCGDEYRKPPFLTASGDLSHHLKDLPKIYEAKPVPGRPGRMMVDSGSVWEGIAGYSRSVRVGNRILVSGTTATHGSGQVVCPRDPQGQTTYILDKISASLAALGGSMEDVVRTRIYLQNADHWEAASLVHGRVFGTIRPANTLVEVGRLIGDYLVEIEAEAIVDG